VADKRPFRVIKLLNNSKPNADVLAVSCSEVDWQKCVIGRMINLMKNFCALLTVATSLQLKLATSITQYTACQ